MTQIKLKRITYNDYKDIHKITSDYDVMKYVGKGEAWSSNKTKKFIKYSIIEYGQKNKTNYFYKIVNSDGILVGIIGVHKYSYEKTYNLTRFLNKKYFGKGYGSRAVLLLINKIKKTKIKRIYSQSLENNIRAQKSIQKVGFVYDKKIKINGKLYKQYFYIL